MTIVHRSVLLQEVLNWIRPKPGGTYVDATLGLGGHAERILEETDGRGRVLGIEWDEDALQRAGEKLARFGEAFQPVCGNFADLAQILENRDIRKVDGILFDLGVSSLQLDDPSRGFSLQRDGPLDMRMSRRSPRTAAELLQKLGERELEEVLRTYGEERRARRIAKAIVRLRGKRPGEGDARGGVLERTRALAEFIGRQLSRSSRIHPATRVFQALRIAVNDELGNLKKVLDVVDEFLGNGGRVLFISFHSLEDREVKRAFREKERAGRVTVLTRKPIVPSEEECGANPRARSAKLRIAEKT